MSKGWGSSARDAGKDGGKHAAGKDKGGLFSRNTGRHVKAKVKAPRSGKRAAVRDGYEKKPWWW